MTLATEEKKQQLAELNRELNNLRVEIMHTITELEERHRNQQRVVLIAATWITTAVLLLLDQLLSEDFKFFLGLVLFLFCLLALLAWVINQAIMDIKYQTEMRKRRR